VLQAVECPGYFHVAVAMAEARRAPVIGFGNPVCAPSRIQLLL